MKLGVDIDGVVLDSGPLYHKAFQKRGLKLDPKKKGSWSFTEMYNTKREISEEIFKEVEQVTDVPLIPGSQILNKIVNLPHIESPIHFVSSRSPESFRSTFTALNKHFPFWSSPFILSCGTDKGKYCNENKLDFFVEDGPPHIDSIYRGSATKIYILDKPYNRGLYMFEADKESVLRVKSWDEILIDLQREGYREAVRVSEPSPGI